MVIPDETAPCPCGSGRPFGQCCGPILGGTPAPTAEALMRSRYTAFTIEAACYLRETWHASTRPERLELTGGPRWLGLEIRATEAGGPEAAEGKVEFVARYRDGRGEGRLHETSRFVREEGRWFYVDGVIHPEPERTGRKPGRNEPCPCGSGRKFKQCCGR